MHRKLVTAVSAAVGIVAMAGVAVAQQPAAALPAAEPASPPASPQMPPLPSMEGQQGEVISHSAVSAPNRKKHLEEMHAAGSREAAKPAEARHDTKPSHAERPAAGRVVARKSGPGHARRARPGASHAGATRMGANHRGANHKSAIRGKRRKR